MEDVNDARALVRGSDGDVVELIAVDVAQGRDGVSETAADAVAAQDQLVRLLALVLAQLRLVVDVDGAHFVADARVVVVGVVRGADDDVVQAVAVDVADGQRCAKVFARLVTVDVTHHRQTVVQQIDLYAHEMVI